jgi:hypothetical protein
VAGKHNIVRTQGDTFNFNFTVATDGVAWNLSTYTCRMQVRRSASTTATLLDLSSPDDITLTSLGAVSITASSTVMSDMPVGKWVYDIELESGGGEVTTILSGRFIVQSEVTA